MGEHKPIQVELTEEELTELLRDLPPYNPDLRKDDTQEAIKPSSNLAVS